MDRGQEFIEPSPEHFLALLSPGTGKGQYGGAIVPIYTGALRQRGFGFLSLLRSIGSTVLPIMRKTILPAMAPALGEFASGLVSDLGSGGTSLKEAVKQRGKAAARQTFQNIQKQQSGGGIQKKKFKKQPPKRVAKKKTATKGRRKAVRKPVGRRPLSRADVFSLS